MKTALIIALAFGTAITAPLGSARALELAAPASRQVYTCEAGGLSRVATTQPAPCCTGMLGCPQLLANTGFLKSKRHNRT